MVDVAPLRGVLYNQDIVKINDVLAPPYDVISSAEQESLYKKSDYNIVRLILGKKYEQDTEENNRYTRAGKDFKEWINREILKQSKKPCIYYYIQEYTTEKGEKIRRKGFIARNRIETFEEGNIMPHEYTMGGPKEDRLKLMKACHTNFSQVFMTYSDANGDVDKAFVLPEKPIIDEVDPAGVRDILYVIEDENVINKVCSLMKDKKLLIADGHHRYETSIAYRNYMRSQNPSYTGEEGFNYVMCYYTNLDDESLRVYPTHRIVQKSIDSEGLINSLDEYFDKKEYEFNESTKKLVREVFVSDLEKENDERLSFGAYFRGIGKFYIFSLIEKEKINQILAEKGVPEVLRTLDLTVLHKITLSDMLQFSEEEQFKQNGIKYIKKGQEAFSAIDMGSASAVFIMASPKIQDIKNVSEAGYRMPQKSTYFYPKLTSGLVINLLD